MRAQRHTSRHEVLSHVSAEVQDPKIRCTTDTGIEIRKWNRTTTMKTDQQADQNYKIQVIKPSRRNA